MATETTGSREGLDTEIGTKENPTLKPARVKIVRVEIVKVGKEKKNEKLVCFCKHPDKEEVIELSNVKYIEGDKMINSGLWVNKDEDGKIRKNSVLAQFMSFLGAKKVSELENKEIDTVLQDRYLVMKAYS